MHILLFAVALAAQTRSQPPDSDPGWTLVNRGAQHTTYLDSRSIQTRGTVRDAWTRSDYDVPTETGAFRTYFRQDLNCARRTFMMTEFVSHGRNGRVIGEGVVPAERRRESTAQPDTQAATLLDMVCN